ncbi:MAG: PASTA domain-containing protein [Rubricoccaceae bacterium]
MSTSPSPNPRLTAVFKQRAFWLGMLGIASGLVAFAFLFNYAVMPLWTRHDAAVTVPDLRNASPEEAERLLRNVGLRGQMREQPFNPTLQADVVVDQTPSMNTQVKPGRRVYYYVNASPREHVVVPNLISLAEGVVRERLREAGLEVGQVSMDTLRSPNRNTVLRQLPLPGRQVPRGTRVQLWLSPGPGTQQVRVPNVVGLTPAEARDRLRAAGLWVDSPSATGERVLSQEPRAGELLQEGREVLIYTAERAGNAASLPPANPPRPSAPPPATPPDPSPAEPDEEMPDL